MDEFILKQRRLKIIAISIPNDRPITENEIVECQIENPFQQTPFRLSIDRIDFFLKKGKTFYYLDSNGKEINIKVHTATDRVDSMIQTVTKTHDSLVFLPRYASKRFVYY